jgi:hypothetical protein
LVLISLLCFFIVFEVGFDCFISLLNFKISVKVRVRVRLNLRKVSRLCYHPNPNLEPNFVTCFIGQPEGFANFSFYFKLIRVRVRVSFKLIKVKVRVSKRALTLIQADLKKVKWKIKCCRKFTSKSRRIKKESKKEEK